jgi:hypothetical protein
MYPRRFHYGALDNSVPGFYRPARRCPDEFMRGAKRVIFGLAENYKKPKNNTRSDVLN